MKLVAITGTMLCLFFNACKTVYKPNPVKNAAVRRSITPADSIVQKEQQGNEFFASGNEPVYWTLEADLDRGFSFKPANGRLLIASPVPVTTFPEAEVYEVNTDPGKMTITVFKKNCSLNGTADKILRTVEVTIMDKRYSGCGAYLYNYLLNDIWVLESINNKEVADGGSGKNLPVIEFNLAESKMYGNDGCNDINAGISVQGTHIKFSNFGGTRKSCSANETAKLFAEKLSNKTVDYSIKMGKLTISLSDDSRIVFKKID